MTPSRIGRLTMMRPGVRPSIWRAWRADGHDAVVGRRVGDHRRLVEHDAAALDVHQHVGRAQIDADVLGEHHAEVGGSLQEAALRASVWCVGGGVAAWAAAAAARQRGIRASSATLDGEPRRLGLQALTADHGFLAASRAPDAAPLRRAPRRSRRRARPCRPGSAPGRAPPARSRRRPPSPARSRRCLTRTTPGSSVVNSGAWRGRIPTTPSAPGATTMSTPSSANTSRSAVTICTRSGIQMEHSS